MDLKLMQKTIFLSKQQVTGEKSESSCVFPIAHRPIGIPVRHMEFVSDAAGFAKISNMKELRGTGSIGFNCKGEI